MANNDLDFSVCGYNPMAKDFVSKISKAIPEFSNYKAENKKMIFSYVVMLFDKKSPLWYKEPEYFQRKLLAADCAKFPLTATGNLMKEYKDVVEGTNHEVNILIVAYLASLGDIDYMMLINELIMFHGYSMQVHNSKYDKNAYQTLKDLSEGIRNRTRTIFGSGDQDELTRVRIMLYEKAEKDRQKLNPEAIVKMLDRDGDFPQDWNRYGKEYEVEPLKFHKDEH